MNIKEFLKEYQISMSDLAKISGLSKACIHNLVTGKRTYIAADTAVRIQLATENEVKVCDLLGHYYTRVVARDIDKRLEKFNKGTL